MMNTTRFKKTVYEIAHTIKVSLAMVLPILFIGSITVLLNGFPILGYQQFLDSFMGGMLRSLLLILPDASLTLTRTIYSVAAAGL